MMAKDNDWNYEETRDRIEGILATIESGELGLIEVFERLEEIAVDMRQCEEFLVQQQGRADLLVETLGE